LYNLLISLIGTAVKWICAGSTLIVRLMNTKMGAAC